MTLPVNQIICGDCLEVMRGWPDGCVDAVVTDPPYGVGKAEWDTVFPTTWYAEASRLAAMVVIITDSARLKDSIHLVGDDFIDVMSLRNLNGMTFGPSGYCNWLAAVVAKARPSQGQNAAEFVVRGAMPDHPSPKPIEAMLWLVRRLVTPPGGIVLDPFCGSGTTCVAAKREGFNYIGIDISEEYCEIARRRVAHTEANLFAGQEA